MNLATISVDPALEREAEAVFQAMGLSMTAAVNLFLRQAIREQAFPFPVEDPDRYTEEEMLEMHRQGLAEIRAGHGIVKTLEELEAMTEDG